jgi:hypothetical protein
MATSDKGCPSCGSEDVTGLRPGRFVCANCEAIFNLGVTGSRACEIDCCGVTAIGRCHECRRAFCATHRAIEGFPGNQRIFSDWCTSCQDGRATASAAEDAAREQRLVASAKEIETVADPIERTIRAFTLSAGYDDPGWRRDAILQPIWGMGLGQGVAAQYCTAPWVSENVASYFARRARERGVATDVSVQMKRWSKSIVSRKYSFEVTPLSNGWRFPLGSTADRYGGKDGFNREHHFGAVIMEDGRLGHFDGSLTENQGSSLVLDESRVDLLGGARNGLNAMALARMAYLLGPWDDHPPSVDGSGPSGEKGSTSTEAAQSRTKAERARQVLAYEVRAGAVAGAGAAVRALEQIGVVSIDPKKGIKVRKIGTAKVVLRPRKTIRKAFGKAADELKKFGADN